MELLLPISGSLVVTAGVLWVELSPDLLREVRGSSAAAAAPSAHFMRTYFKDYELDSGQLWTVSDLLGAEIELGTSGLVYAFTVFAIFLMFAFS